MSGPLDLEAIAARADAATPGPWCFYHDDLWRGTAEALADYDADPEHEPWPYGEGTDFPANTGHLFLGDPVRPADAEFIAAARTDMPALLAEVRRLRCAGDHVFPSGLNRTEIHEQFGCDCLVRASEAEEQRDDARRRITAARAVVVDAMRAPRGHAWRYLEDIRRALDGAP